MNVLSEHSCTYVYNNCPSFVCVDIKLDMFTKVWWALLLWSSFNFVCFHSSTIIPCLCLCFFHAACIAIIMCIHAVLIQIKYIHLLNGYVLVVSFFFAVIWSHVCCGVYDTAVCLAAICGDVCLTAVCLTGICGDVYATAVCLAGICSSVCDIVVCLVGICGDVYDAAICLVGICGDVCDTTVCLAGTCGNAHDTTVWQASVAMSV